MMLKNQENSVSLATLGLSDEILQALKDKGYESATPIQKALIPAMFSRRDIMAGAQTGTGKTFTMVGPDAQDNQEMLGVIPRTFIHIFDKINVKSQKKSHLA